MTKKKSKKPRRKLSSDRATQYALDVSSSRIIAGPHVRDAAQRHLNDLELAGDRGLYYDKHEASEGIAFFEECLCLNGGQFEGKPFLLFPWEAFIIGSLFGWKRQIDDTRRFRVVFCETGKGPLAIDTPIATPDGWTVMGELRIGDHVFDDQGRPTRVVDTSPVFYDRECYRLTFSDGEKIVADAEHRWPTASYREKGRIRNKTTEEISDSIYTNRSGQSESKNHSISVSLPLDLPAVELPISPYVLGTWLGDGDTDAARITVHREDWEIVEQIQFEGESVVEQKEHIPGVARVSFATGVGRFYAGRKIVKAALLLENFTLRDIRYETGSDTDRISQFMKQSGMFEMVMPRRVLEFGKGTTGAIWRILKSQRKKAIEFANEKLPFILRLRELGLLGHKHIPMQYLRSSISQRMALFQGIMDTDGSIAPGGKCEITLCNKVLIYDVQELAISLGYKCTVNESAATLNGKEVGRRWRMGFQAYNNFPPFKLKRKVERLESVPRKGIRSRNRHIISCEKVKSVPVKCITVEAESHLFLAGKSLIKLRNSGKSPLCAGVGIKGLVADREERAEIYAAATLKDQAMVLFRDACAMFDQSDMLQDRLIASGVGEKRWNLAYLQTNSFFRVIASDTKKGKSGPRPHMALLDEIHEHADGTIIEMLRAGFKFRTQPLSFMITNSGFDMMSVCREYHDMGTKIADGTIINDEFFSFICSLDEEDYIDSEKNEDDHYLYDELLWPKVNPSLPYGIPGYDYIRSQVREAEGLPSKMSTVKRLNFCVWTESENPAIDKVVWTACQDTDYPLEILKGRKCWGGLDLSAVKDLTAFALLFEPGYINMEKSADNVWTDIDDSVLDPFWRVKVWFWVPGIGLRRKAETDKVPYIAWRDAGYINAIDRKTVAYEFVASDIKTICDQYDPELIAFDRWSKDRFDKEVERLGIELPDMVEHGQGYQSMGPSVKVFETKLNENLFRHDGNPCLTWCASNTVAVEDPTLAKKYDKKRSFGRIDGIIAMVMGCGILQDAFVSAYDGLTEDEMIARMLGDYDEEEEEEEEED